MRLARSYVTVPRDRAHRFGISVAPEDSPDAMAYQSLSRDQLLARQRVPWIVELRGALSELLRPERAVLSLGSGQGEHELGFFLAGYDITASDVMPGVLDDARREFPGFKVRTVDALNPPADEHYDDVLATGIDYLFDADQFDRLLQSAHRLLRPGGRFLLVLRFHDNLATRILDYALVPAWGVIQELGHRLRRDNQATVAWEHGYRRTREEIQQAAERAGYRVGQVRHACFALELARIPIPGPIFRMLWRLDHRLHLFNSATIFELLTVDPTTSSSAPLCQARS
jgi:SAM-dependent methyltransferase